ncbi:hypothetical protein OHS33_15345 [Streptomyces sp. NBC_00536]|uniref:hypothetical protein n=1 Tax=Streptomyces sp. NBC_00536 TaxID=2975769 RepID=UPI002E812700|nr:hypothetical protein [Streptomyces sp. NBC_00536]WUC79579.1 hypothetical protein OHS33_15345 [Streptomyces sp. NBC_00536]
MSALTGAPRLWGGALRLWGEAVRYLDEVSGQAEFRRVCRAHEAAGPVGRGLTAKERRSLWRAHALRTARETNRCC